MYSTRDIGIIADDLTGACDVASCFLDVWGEIEVLVSYSESLSLKSEGVVINTHSRLKSAGECKDLLKSVGLVLKDKSIIFKKIDTALRGCIGAELEGLIEALGQRETLIAPAIPSIGRVTKGGVQYDNCTPISETAYANDPVSPVRSSKISDIIRETGNITCSICDAETDDDLRHIVKDGLSKKKVIFVGSLGLANALATVLKKNKIFHRRRIPSIAKRVIIVSGSFYERTQRQIVKAIEKYGIPLIDIHPRDYPHSCTHNFFMDIIHDNEIIIIRLASGPAHTQNIPPLQLLSWFISNVVSLISEVNPDAIGIIGGETAFTLLKNLNVNTLCVKDKISDVMPFGTVVDGKLAECIFSTKGGSVGSDYAVVKMIQFLKGE